jgi:parallel beta-helix repeat protein
MLAAVAVVGGLLAADPAAATDRAAVHVVGPGQSVQKAVDAAEPGDTVLLLPGTYRESVRITTPDLTLRGAEPDKVTIAAPSATADNGISVAGTQGHRLTGVRIASLTVSGFAKYGITATETDGMVVHGVRAEDNGQYGIGQEKSVRARLVGNVTRGNGEGGLFVANAVSEEGGALDTQGTEISGNATSGNKAGIVLRRVRDTNVQGNSVTGNCAGMFVIGDENVPRAGHLTIRGNAVTANTRYCAATSRLPFVQGAGIVLTGVEATVVEHNTVSGNTGTSPMSGGVVFFKSFVGLPDSDNAVRNNVLLSNGPADVAGWDIGTGNTVTGNTCGVSLPAGRC